MGKIVTIDFQSRVIRTDPQRETQVRQRVRDFEETGTYEAALNLCRSACPECEVGQAHSLPNGWWLIEVRYDNLLHEGKGETPAAALVAAILSISEVIEAEDGSKGGLVTRRH